MNDIPLAQWAQSLVTKFQNVRTPIHLNFAFSEDENKRGQHNPGKPIGVYSPFDQRNFWTTLGLTFREYQVYVVSITLNNNKLSFLPEEFLLLCSQLKRLSLRKNDFHNDDKPLPSDLFTKCSRLERLDLSFTKLNKTKVPSFATLTNLQYLDLGDMDMGEKLPDGVTQLSQLTTLLLRSPYHDPTIFNLNTFFEGATFQLKKLALSERLATNCVGYNFLFTQRSLEWLSLSHNVLGDTLSNEPFDNLSNLQYLDLSSCFLDNVPTGLQRLTALKHLNLTYNYNLEFTRLVDNPFPALETLELDFLEADDEDEGVVLDGFGRVTQLTKLTLRHCGFTEVPDFIQNLTNLRVLDLSSNNLSTLPNWFTNLNQLEKLNLAKNAFDTVPEVLSSMPDNFEVDFQGNFLDQPFPEWLRTFFGLRNDNTITFRGVLFEELNMLKVREDNGNLQFSGSPDQLMRFSQTMPPAIFVNFQNFYNTVLREYLLSTRRRSQFGREVVELYRQFLIFRRSGTAPSPNIPFTTDLQGTSVLLASLWANEISKRTQT